MPNPTVAELAAAFKAAIDKADAAALTRLAKTYKVLYQRMQGKLDSYLLALSRLQNPTKGQVMRMTQYQALIDALESELTKYSAYVEVELRNSVDGAVEMAIKQTKTFLEAAGYSMPQSLPKDAIVSMLGFLKEDAPLWERIKLLSKGNTQKVADALLEGIAFGYNPAKTARMFETVMGGGLTDAMRMTRTAQLYASREANRAMYVANDDVVTGWIWYSSLDTDTCMACAAEHGTFHTNDEPMDSHYNCFPAGVLVTGPTPIAGTKRDYSGELVSIRTASGVELSFTPNHPILTRSGWIAGGLLQKGDYVIRSAGRKNTDSAIDIDYNDIPTVIEKIVESFDVVLVEVPTAAKDFHGDGIGSKVHTVLTNSLLGSEISTAFSEPLIEQNFSMGASIDNPLASNGGLNQRLIGAFAAPNGFVRGRSVGLSLFGSFLTRLQEIGLRETANMDALFEQAIANDISGNTEKFSDSVFRFPIEIELDKIVDINRSVFSGQVYNLQTTHEWYVANSIITHNCRCTSIPVVKGYDDKIQTGADWFKGLSEKEQRDMMGGDTYAAWKEGKFDLADMATRRHDDVYGEMLARVPLQDLLANASSEIELSEREIQSIHSWGVSGKDIRNVQSGNTAGMTAQEIRDAERSLGQFNSAIDKLPKYEGEIYRGLHDIPDNVIDKWQNGAIIELNNHQSATSLSGVGAEFAGAAGLPDKQNVMWIAEQTTGVDLKGLTNVTYGGKTVNESEILMTKGSKYEIIKSEFWVKDVLWDDAKIDWYFEGTEYNHANMPDGFRLDNEFRGYYKIFLKELK